MSFDCLAPYYTGMERVLAGQRLQRCRTAWIDTLARCENMLIAGVGHGHFLAAHTRRFPGARITCIDASASMLEQARSRAQRAGARMRNLEFIHAVLPAWTPPAHRFDGIVTHFFLDCFAPAELPRVISALAGAAGRNAAWLVSDFAIPAGGFARHRARAVHGLMYAFFRRVTKISARSITPPDELLRAEGFQLSGRASSNWGLLRADRWQRGLNPANTDLAAH